MRSWNSVLSDLDGFEMPVERVLNVGVLILKGNSEMMNCSSFKLGKFFEHSVKVVEMVS